jgi:hypothetical protein
MRTRPPKRGKHVVNNIRVKHVDVHMDQDSSGLNRWHGTCLRHTVRGEGVANDITRAIMLRGGKQDNPSELVGDYVTKHQMMMEAVREIHPTQHIHLLDVSCTSRLEIMAPDGTIRRELPSRKQVSMLFPLMDPWEIMASSLSLNLSRILVIWVNPFAPFLSSANPGPIYPLQLVTSPCISCSRSVFLVSQPSTSSEFSI